MLIKSVIREIILFPTYGILYISTNLMFNSIIVDRSRENSHLRKVFEDIRVDTSKKTMSELKRPQTLFLNDYDAIGVP